MKHHPGWYILFLIAVSTIACVRTIKPEFDLQDNLLFVDAYALTEKGASTVRIQRSVVDRQQYRTDGIAGAQVQFEQVGTSRIIDLLEGEDGLYFSPRDFATVPGETWRLLIELADGRRYESSPQTVSTSIPIGDISVDYSPEVDYDDTRNRFVPGHRMLINWTDPAEETNYYLWKYRSFEPLIVCKTCVQSRLRNGSCQNVSGFGFRPYYNYVCDTACWQIRYGDELPIYDDLLTNGEEIQNFEVGIVPYYRKQPILIELQQLSLNESSYQYFKVINDLISNNSGLNAPPPAALLGNIVNPEDDSDLVLGQFTATAASTRRIYLERDDIMDRPYDPDPSLVLENCLNCPTTYPCFEGAFRTSFKPEGWP